MMIMKSNNKLMLVIGAGGHAKVIVDILQLNKEKNIKLFDDFSTTAILGIDIAGKIKDVREYMNENAVIAIGDNSTRRIICEKYNLNYVSCFHPNAVVARDAQIGNGTVVMANAVINSGSKIGNQCIINTSAIVEHDNCIGDYVHISPGVRLGGRVTIGNNTWVGIGATIKNNIHICNDVTIGAGAIVVNDIDTPGTYIGIPARAK